MKPCKITVCRLLYNDVTSELLTATADAIKAFQALEEIRPPDREQIKPMSANLAHKVHEPHYWDGPDALRLLDLKKHNTSTPRKKAKMKISAPPRKKAKMKASVGEPTEAAMTTTTEATDSLRIFLQARAPASMLDRIGREQRSLHGEHIEAGGRTCRINSRYLPPITDLC